MPLDAALLLALAALCLVTVGAVLQRVSGMGVGMIAASTLSVLFGPVVGVSMSNVAAICSAGVLFAMLRRDVDWPRFARLAPLLVLGSLAGAWAVRLLDERWLEVVLGASVLVAIAAALGLQRRVTASGPAATLGSGAVAGFMNTTAGVAGPALAVYAVASKWEQRSWAATLQPVFLLANTTSLVTKSLVGTGVDVPSAVDPLVWAGVLLGVPTGIALGGTVARRVDAAAARRVALVVAAAGGTITLVRGAAQLVL